jgi:hypothetical protein
MDSTLSLASIEDRIAAIRANIQQLTEQAAAVSGGRSEDVTADRIAQQTEELETMIRRRDELQSGK